MSSLPSPVQLSDEELAGQLVVFGFPEVEPPQSLLEALAERRCAGVVLFRRNLEGRSLEQIQQGCAQLRSTADPDFPPFIALDEEGGRVQRLPEPALRIPPMAQLAKGGVEMVERVATVLGQQLRALGFTLNFAPVVDVNSNPDNPVIGDRAFGDDPVAVIELAGAYCEALHETGVGSCLKHFPGHGDTDLDSHLALPRVRHGWPRLRDVELFPFSELVAVADSVMTAHVVFDAVDASTPATLCARWIEGVLRGEMAFDGVVFSDDIDMRALDAQGPIDEVAVRAIDAGCDVLLACGARHEPLRVHEAITKAIRSGRPYFRERCEQAARRSLALRRSLVHPAATLEDLQEVMRTRVQPMQKELQAAFPSP